MAEKTRVMYKLENLWIDEDHMLRLREIMERRGELSRSKAIKEAIDVLYEKINPAGTMKCLNPVHCLK